MTGQGATPEEDEWRLLCRGHLDGSIFEAGLSDDRTPVSVGPLTVDPAGRRVDVNGAGRVGQAFI